MIGFTQTASNGPRVNPHITPLDNRKIVGRGIVASYFLGGTKHERNKTGTEVGKYLRNDAVI